MRVDVCWNINIPSGPMTCVWVSVCPPPDTRSLCPSPVLYNYCDSWSQDKSSFWLLLATYYRLVILHKNWPHLAGTKHQAGITHQSR